MDTRKINWLLTLGEDIGQCDWGCRLSGYGMFLFGMICCMPGKQVEE